MRPHVPLSLLFAGALFVVMSGSLVHAQERFPSQGVGWIPGEALSPDVQRSVLRAMQGRDGVGKDGPLATVGMELATLYFQYEQSGPAGIRALREKRARRVGAKTEGQARGEARVRLPISADGRFVTIDAVASGQPSSLFAELRDIGLRNGATIGNVVSGRLPVSAIEDAAQLASLRGMLPAYARTHAGRVGSEADTAHRAVEVRANLGVDGAGQKICALSDSYDRVGASPSATDDVNSGDLPGEGNPAGRTTPVDVLDDNYNTSDFPSPRDEGRAMLQLIHDIAPGAELGFHTAFGGIANFASGIRELARDGSCTVIVDDVGYFAQPFYQDGPVTRAVTDVVDAGVPYFSSAGNDGQNSYEAPFRGSGQQGVLNSASELHDFDPSGTTDTRQEITVAADGSFQVVSLQWTDPSALVDGSAGADTDLDMALVDPEGTVVKSSATNNRATGVPFETMEYENDTGGAVTLDLVIEKAAGPDPQEVKYIYGGSGFTIEEFDTLGPTIYGHPRAEDAMAVAAAPFYNTAAYNANADPAVLEPFSSKGGIPVLFDQDGERLSVPQAREKPDVTGTDGIDNTFFGQDLPTDFPNTSNVDPDPHPNFFGTSAAAPNVAAIAGLVRQARPGFSPADVYDRLKSTAADVTERLTRDGQFVSVATGPDPWSGRGFVRANRAVPTPRGVQIVNLTGRAAPDGERGTVELQWSVVGRGSADNLLLEKRYFDGSFSEQERIAAAGESSFSTTVRDLPVGQHTFRVTAFRNDTTLTQTSTAVVLRGRGTTVSAYPNPFRERVNLSVTLGPDRRSDRVRVTVYDALGRRIAVPVRSRAIEESRSITLEAAEMGALSAGVYFVRVEGDTFTKTVQVAYVP